jgi:hypothetical protein
VPELEHVSNLYGRRHVSDAEVVARAAVDADGDYRPERTRPHRTRRIGSNRAVNNGSENERVLSGHGEQPLDTARPRLIRGLRRVGT